MKAESRFREAIEKDPNFARAYVGLADTLAMERGPKAFEASLAHAKALELDNSLAEAHASRGFYMMFQVWNWREAETSLKQAIALDPNYATAHQWMATLRAVQGRVKEAIANMQLALEIDRTSPNFLADMGQMHYFARDYERAIEYCRKALEQDPSFLFAHEYLKAIYIRKGMYAEAVDEAAEQLRSYSRFDNYKPDPEPQIRKFKAAFQQTGFRGWLRLLLDEVEGRKRAVSAYSTAVLYAIAGQEQQALYWLDKAWENKDPLMMFAGVDPVWDDLRSEPLFQKLLKQMNLL